MRKTRGTLAIAVAALTALLMACGPASSLNPLFTENDLIFDHALVGEWIEKGQEHAGLRFEKAGPMVYRVTNIEPARDGGEATETKYEAHLVRLGAYRFLDVAPLQMGTTTDSESLGPVPASKDPAEPRLLRIGEGFYMELQGSRQDDSNYPARANLRRGHWIFRLENSRRTLTLTPLDSEWLKNAIDQSEVDIAHSFVDVDNKEFVITAPVSELQRLILDHATDQEAFPDANVFVRVQ